MYSFVFLFIGLLGGGVIVFIILQAWRLKFYRERTEFEKKAIRIEHLDHTLKQRESEISNYLVTRAELRAENGTLKQDLQNLEVHLRKLQLDRGQQKESQEALDNCCRGLGKEYLKEQVNWIGRSLNPNNYSNCHKRLTKVITKCRKIGLVISAQEEAERVADLKAEFKRVVRVALEREEQARIRAQIRAEQKLAKEIEKEIAETTREREAVEEALAHALAEATDKHSAEIEALRARLTEAESRSERAISQAQLTRAGHVYVISNIGSFGKGVYKIGMMRRLEPLDRVKELGDASVPFPFDIHMMISSDNAPALENTLHRELHEMRVNKVNPRKEFFRTDFEMIRELVENNHGKVEYVADAEALDYQQSLIVSDEDATFIEEVYEDITHDLSRGSSPK